MADETWTVRRILGWTQGYFEKRNIDSPRLTAELLLAHALSSSRVKLYTDFERPLSKEELASYRALIERRASGTPAHYLLGSKGFYNHDFKVTPAVLIPRPETELLVEAVLRLIPKDAPTRVLDLCTGSGCIAVSIAAERPLASVMATDLSPEACAVARENAGLNDVGGRVSVLEGDLFAPLPADARFDLIVSNPPYIATVEIETLSREVRSEPRLALDGGADGLHFYRRIARETPARLKAGGSLALEIGETQGAAVKALLEQAGWIDVRVEKDLERRDRHVFARSRAAELPRSVVEGPHG